MKPFYRFLTYVILASGALVLLTYANNLRIIFSYLIITSCIAGYIDWRMDKKRTNSILKRYYEKYPEEYIPSKPNVILTKIKSLLKAIWGNIWPTKESFKDIEYPKPNRPNLPPGFINASPHEQLDIKLTDDLTWLKSMAGAYVFWEKDRYEVWREEGMFYIAIPNKETGSVFCSTSAGGVLNMARETLKKHRENILKCANSRRRPKDFREQPWEQSYIVPANMMLYDDLIYMKGDVVSYDQLSKIIKPEMLDEYAKAWRYKLPELTIEPCSEQSVILPKMDEIANSPRIYSWEDFLSLRQFAEAPYDTYIGDMERARRRRLDILNSPPKSIYDDLGIKHPLDNEHK